jgi:hypothetical protein
VFLHVRTCKNKIWRKGVAEVFKPLAEGVHPFLQNNDAVSESGVGSP